MSGEHDQEREHRDAIAAGNDRAWGDLARLLAAEPVAERRPSGEASAVVAMLRRR